MVEMQALCRNNPACPVPGANVPELGMTQKRLQLPLDLIGGSIGVVAIEDSLRTNPCKPIGPLWSLIFHPCRVTLIAEETEFPPVYRVKSTPLRDWEIKR